MNKNMNNRGFAITTIIFGILILFMFLLISLLSILAIYRNNLGKLVDDRDSAHGARSIATIKKDSRYSSFDALKNSTDKTSGLYCFGSECRYVARSELYPSESILEDVHELAFTGASSGTGGDCNPVTAKYGGYYYVKLCGAQGGAAVDVNGSVKAIGGKGACTEGYLKLSAGETIYVCVGGVGKTVSYAKAGSLAGGFNGGGSGYAPANTSVGSGGGATDIRLVNGTWNNATSLNSRIMVAAGGGGAGYSTSGTSTGGGGGSLLGISAYGYGASQTAGGSRNKGGSFGTGGSGVSGGAGAGGGGGYYGGGSGQNWQAAGGGSSFISGYAGTNAVTSASSSAASNDTVHYSGKYFVKPVMTSATNTGNGSAIIQFSGVNPPEKQHNSLNKIRYIRDCINGSDARVQKVHQGSVNFGSWNLWTEIQAIDASSGRNVAKGKSISATSASADKANYNNVLDGLFSNMSLGQYCSSGDLCIYWANGVGRTKDSGLQCVTIDLGAKYNLEEISIWHYYKSDIMKDNSGSPTFKENWTYISENGSTWLTVIDKSKKENSMGRRISLYTPIEAEKYVDIGRYTGKLYLYYNNKTVLLENTNIQLLASAASSNWKLKFISSGTLTMNSSINVDAFLVGGGGGGTFCCGAHPGEPGACPPSYTAGSGGYHTVFSTSLVANSSYDIVVGASQKDTVAFGHTAKKGGNGKTYLNDCKGRDPGGAACGEFETSGSEYSGVQKDGAPNSGKSNQAGTVIIRPKQ